MDTGTVSEKPWISPSDKRIAGDAARQGDKVRREAIEKAMRAGWADQDADVSNWLDEAARAHPGPNSAVRVLYGVTQRLIDRLAEETGDDRERIPPRDGVRPGHGPQSVRSRISRVASCGASHCGK